MKTKTKLIKKINLSYKLTIEIQESRMRQIELYDIKRKLTAELKSISSKLSTLEAQRHEVLLEEANKEIKLTEEYLDAKGR